MAAGIRKYGYNGRRSGRDGGPLASYRPLAEINVTPFVDVMLVLLIVFMVTAPLLAVGVPVDLPKTRAATLSDSSEPLVVTIQASGNVFLQEREVNRDELVAILDSVSQGNPDRLIYVRGDSKLPYGSVMEVMGVIVSGGFRRVTLEAKQPS